MQTRLSTFVKIDNRYRIKNFLQGRENDLIVMEDLDIGYSKTKSKKVNYLLKRLSIQNIKNDLLKYCKEAGIQTKLINPAFTSQTCPVCGHISKDNRKTQEMFCCVKCNHTDNADHNASINIKERINDSRISLNTPFWRVKEILQVDN
jgi:putative transposase